MLDKKSIEKAIAVEPFVDALLLDSGNLNLDVKVLGGTGKKHNWYLSGEIREKISIPLFLAGGLNPENVVDAINQVQPFGLDICSGVRTKGKLDEEKVKLFFSEVNKVNAK